MTLRQLLFWFLAGVAVFAATYGMLLTIGAPK